MAQMCNVAVVIRDPEIWRRRGASSAMSSTSDRCRRNAANEVITEVTVKFCPCCSFATPAQKIYVGSAPAVRRQANVRGYGTSDRV